MRVLFTSIFAIIFALSAAGNTTPKAPPLVFEVGANSHVVIRLRGYDLDGDKLKAYITSVPGTGEGELYDLTQVYSEYGHEPSYSTSTLISLSTGNHKVTDKKKRLVYKAPPNTSAPRGKPWAKFTYIVKDGKGGISAEGTVTLVPQVASGGIVAGSDFTTGSDSWVIVDNGAKQGIVHEKTSQGLLSYFVYSTDDVILIDPVTKDDNRQWYFEAPSKFLGYQLHGYGGTLQFTLGAFSGDFGKTQSTRNSVILECTACAMHQGMRFVVRNLVWDGSTKVFTVPLTELGWLKDPKSTLASAKWNPPSECEMVEMLSNLSALKILGDYTQWHESVGLDDVKIVPGLGLSNSSKNVNVNCLCANPGTQC